MQYCAYFLKSCTLLPHFWNFKIMRFGHIDTTLFSILYLYFKVTTQFPHSVHFFNIFLIMPHCLHIWLLYILKSFYFGHINPTLSALFYYISYLCHTTCTFVFYLFKNLFNSATLSPHSVHFFVLFLFCHTACTFIFYFILKYIFIFLFLHIKNTLFARNIKKIIK